MEELWPSMDLIADMFLERVEEGHRESVQAERLRPRMVRHFTGLPGFGGSRMAHNADRLLNRFWRYPSWLRKRAADFDVFHLVDHSYAQLVHELPAGRTVVTCHDLETFRCLVDSGSRRRGSWVHRSMARRTLSGLQRAVRVTCDSQATRNELITYGLVAADRVRVVANGVNPACSPHPDAAADLEAERLLGPAGTAPEVLNVGSTVPRKRVDVLLRAFGEVRRRVPDARLIRVGGPFTPGQSVLAGQAGLADSVRVLPFVSRAVLSAVYRRAAVVAQPSEYEGFGLPIVEAMACGSVVLASDIPVFREVGGTAVCRCPVGDVPAWSRALVELMDERRDSPAGWQQRRAAGLARAAEFSWEAYAAKMVALYREVLAL
ncbi:MAG TPA: glycosyltransferase family 1 protein [Bryobacteraceae bacterium]